MRNFTREQIQDAIDGSGGIISFVARKLGCDWHTAKTAIAATTEQRAAFDMEKQSVLDMAETQIIQAIKDGDLSVCKWYLSTKGRSRGYSTTVDVQSNVSIVDVQSMTREQRQKRIAELEAKHKDNRQ
jgi:hypothetical protein